ncbi:pyridoxine 5'-phosphate synthase [Lacihabitans sp. CS3-21]|uniref:pyridoxine 5'-phosphate synthase n=1 Tax=Lacihabitans sp. CS3-21 TaxID=2487332 RepID=UPI0020CE4BF2|nr:pyridoxine 5'-phosphate synthase [Lacihabitans sp. CS3-21]MCP9748099.1 pyridoxine 5'-phosphate synthase [Lacihabitans sp. CS3-21]
MTKLSVNINKIATLRNSRGGNMPDLVKTAIDCEIFGAQGITVHPRPDERHIKYQDVFDLKKVVKTEFNIEGNPTEGRFQEVVLAVKPEQVTLVPDELGAITSNAGWDTISYKSKLKEIVNIYKSEGIRVSIFVDANPEMVEAAAETGTDRIELYTESYAAEYAKSPEKAIESFIKAAEMAQKVELGINAGHDLSLENLAYFYKNIPGLLEVSIGHALICDALYYGLENTIQLYLRQLEG